MQDKKIITLGDLKKEIETTAGKELPTAYSLRNSGERIVAEKIFRDGNALYVYENGFALYKSQRHNTVFRVDRCGGYTYFTRTGELTYCEGYFDRQKWAVRLLIEAEDRIQHNLAAQDEKHASPVEDAESNEQMEARIEDMDAAIELLSVLTQKQRRYFYLRYLKGYQVQEIAAMHGVTSGAVTLSLQSAKRKIQKKLKGY